MSKRVFISMPMNGKDRSEIISAQQKILESVSARLNEPVVFVESYLNEVYKLKPLECLAESLKRMASADYVVFAEGWEKARGCRVERMCAEAYGIAILDI